MSSVKKEIANEFSMAQSAILKTDQPPVSHRWLMVKSRNMLVLAFQVNHHDFLSVP